MSKYLLLLMLSYCLCVGALNDGASQSDKRLKNPGSNRVRRKVLGAPSEQNAGDPKYQGLAKEALDKHLKQANVAACPPVTITVKKATEQVVAGTKTEIQFTAHSDRCTSLLTCSASIWEQSWVNKKEITVNCQ